MLPWFTKYPNQNDEILNLDWVIKQVENLKAAYEAFLAANSLTFADPIVWDITKQYSKNTIVLSSEGDAYLSKKAIGKGIQLNNTDYWLEIFNFAEYVRTANSNLTLHIEQNTTRAIAAYAVDDWLLWDDVLYKVTADISPDDLLTVGTNIVHFTVEDFCRALATYMVNTIDQYKRDIDASELQFNNTMTGLVNQYKNDIDASEAAYRLQLAGDITATTNSLQAQLDAAIAGATVDSEVINARVGADGKTYATLGDAIRSQIGDIMDINKDHFLMNISGWTDNKAVNVSTGEVGTVASYSLNSGYIPEGCTKLFVFAQIDSASAGIAFYNSDGTFISGESFDITTPASLTDNVIDVPVNAASFKFSTMTVAKSDTYIMDLTNFNSYYNQIKDFILDAISYLLGSTGDYTLAWVNDEYINESTGAFSSYVGFKRTGYIEIAANVKELIFTSDYRTQFCAFYDSNQICIGGFAIDSGVTHVKVPINAVYFAVSIGNNHDISNVANKFFTVQKLTAFTLHNEKQINSFEDFSNEICETYKGSEIQISDVESNFILLKNLPHNILTLDRVAKTVSSVTVAVNLSTNTITLNGTNAASAYTEISRVTLPEGEYYLKITGTENVSLKVSGNVVRNSPKYSGPDGSMVFGVLGDSEPVLIELGIIRDIAYSNSEFTLTLTKVFNSLKVGDVPKGSYNVYMKDSSNNITTYEIDDNISSLLIPVPLDKTVDIYTDYSFILQAALPKREYYGTDMLNKPYNYSGKNALIVGDSIALGYWSNVTHAEYFATYFKDRSGLSAITNVAIGGATYSTASLTGNVLEELQGVTLSDYDVIIILCGTNDYTSGVDESAFNTALGNISTYINSNANPDAQIIIITPCGRTREANTFVLPLGKYREMIAFWAMSNKYTLLDGSKMGIPDIASNYSTLVLADGIHPNALGHWLIAEYMSKLL